MGQQQILCALNDPRGEVDNAILAACVVINASACKLDGIIGKNAFTTEPCKTRNDFSLSNLGDE